MIQKGAAAQVEVTEEAGDLRDSTSACPQKHYGVVVPFIVVCNSAAGAKSKNHGVIGINAARSTCNEGRR